MWTPTTPASPKSARSAAQPIFDDTDDPTWDESDAAYELWAEAQPDWP